MKTLDKRAKRPETPETDGAPSAERRTSAFKFAFFWFVMPTIVLMGLTVLQHHHA